MNIRQPLQPILQHLFQVSNLEDVSWQRLESFVAEYPAFGIGHYLLSRKLRTERSDRFAEETQRTSLYFTNPYWLEWLLQHEESNGAPAAVMAESTEVAPPPIEANVESNVVRVAEEAFAVESVAEEPVLQVAEEPVAVVEETVAPPEVPVVEETALPPEEPVSLAQVSPPVSEEPQQDKPEPSAADLLLRSIEQARELRESLHRLNRNFEKEEGGDLAAPTTVAHEEPASEPATEEDLPTPNVAHAAALAEPTQIEAKAAAAAIVFEPYHTIDYFASLGIKLNLDENPGDQLGRQLKSFTEWLKVMRRLPKKEAVVIPDRVAEQEIRDIAEHSIERKEVVTETMAEVFVKQGMKDAARAVYEKLSLLNPDKRGYFAAKIEQLNIH
jgi:hypothetical protein